MNVTARRSRFTQLFERSTVSAKALDLGAEAPKVRFGQQYCSIRVREPANIVGLMVFGRIRPRDKNCWHPGNSHLMHGARSATSDQQISCLVDRRHVLFVTNELVLNTDCTSIARSDLIDCVDKSFSSCLTDGQPAVVRAVGEVLRNDTIEDARSLRATHDGDEEPVGSDPEPLTSRCTACRAIDIEDRLSDRRPGHFGAR